VAKIEIDKDSGFCFGVTTAIRKAEEELDRSGRLYCLGDIVHNAEEVERLRAKGLITITHEQLHCLHGVKVLLRAHGEPPETYRIAQRNNIEIIDATCPVVLKLQQRIKATFDAARDKTPDARPQIVIYGKRGHAEVNGLVGQTDGSAIVVEGPDGLDKIDFKRPVALYSQTTKPLEGFKEIIDAISAAKSADGDDNFTYYDTICRSVANRVPHLRRFAAGKELVLFVAGAKSSNGRVLFNECRAVNPRTHLIAGPDEIDPAWLEGVGDIGICGATSTPSWLMERVSERVDILTAGRAGSDD